MNRMFRPTLFLTAVACLAVPAMAQTPPTQAWPQNRPPTPRPPRRRTRRSPLRLRAAAATPPATAATRAPGGGVPLPQWFVDIDVDKKGEVTRADFLKYRMKSFETLDPNKDNKLSVEEFIKVVEPPVTPADAPGLPPLEERRSRARAEFQNLDTNRDGFVERGEAEALVHSEFNNYDTDRDNKITEPEVRLIIQRALQREAAERQQAEQRRRQGMMALERVHRHAAARSPTKLDKNKDTKISEQEYTGPAPAPPTARRPRT